MSACVLQCSVHGERGGRGDGLIRTSVAPLLPHRTAGAKHLGRPNNNNQRHLCVRNGDIELGAAAAYGADHVRIGVFRITLLVTN